MKLALFATQGVEVESILQELEQVVGVPQKGAVV